jgi:hypothetical protein
MLDSMTNWGGAVLWVLLFFAGNKRDAWQHDKLGRYTLMVITFFCREQKRCLTAWQIGGVHLNDYYFFREGIKEMLDSMTNWGGTLYWLLLFFAGNKRDAWQHDKLRGYTLMIITFFCREQKRCLTAWQIGRVHFNDYYFFCMEQKRCLTAWQIGGVHFYDYYFF